MFTPSLYILTLFVLLYFIVRKTSRRYIHMFPRAFLIGMGVLFFLQAFIYSIGRDLRINLYFFDLTITGKDALGQFEDVYRNLIGELLANNSIFQIIGIIFLPAVIEEIAKLVGIIFIAKHYPHHRSIKDYLFVGLFVALGFAIAENAIYISNFIENGYTRDQVGLLGTIRTILGLFSHIFFTLLVAYGYGYSRFSKYHTIEKGLLRDASSYHFLSRLPLIGGELVAHLEGYSRFWGGVLLGILAHIVYNFFLFFGFSNLAFLFILLGNIVIFRAFWTDKLTNTDYGTIDQKIEVLTLQSELNKRKKKVFPVRNTSQKKESK